MTTTTMNMMMMLMMMMMMTTTRCFALWPWAADKRAGMTRHVFVCLVGLREQLLRNDCQLLTGRV
ncbi:hypothetical protein DIPPA_31761 [Diplonema papillatum]|nr:hypothetical protein DIPPA_31761 [Diplonema papillatum]